MKSRIPTLTPVRILIVGNTLPTVEAAALVANVAPLDPGEWVQLAPYGRFPVGITNAVGARNTEQVFERAHAERIVTEFNSALGKLGRAFRGSPVFAGHPDLDSARWPDERRIGKIVALEARADGIYGQPAWNTLGTENLAQGYLVYPSIVWRCEQRGRELHPFALKSVGLTNEPNIPGVAPVTANATDKPNTTDMNPKDLAALLGLDPETATPDSITTSIKSLHDKVAANAKPPLFAVKLGANGETEVSLVSEDQAAIVRKLGEDLTAANTARTSVETTLQMQRKAHAEVLVANAIREGRATGADKGTLLAAFETDFVKAESDLAALKPKFNTRRLEVGNRKPEHLEAAQRTTQIKALVHARMDANPSESYDQAYGNVKADPKHAALFATAKKEGN